MATQIFRENRLDSNDKLIELFFSNWYHTVVFFGHLWANLVVFTVYNNDKAAYAP